MRWLFAIFAILVLEIFIYAACRSLQWFSQHWLPHHHSQWIFWIIFAISHFLLIAGVMRITPHAIKFFAIWFSILWFVIIMAIMTAILHISLNKLTILAYTTWLLPTFFMTGVIFLIGLGLYNAYTPTIRYLHIETKHQLTHPLRIGMVSDLHLGLLVGNRELDLLTQIVQQQNIDVLLIPGDVLDDNTLEYQRKNMHNHLTQLVKTVPMGVFATLGNHDLYGHQAEISHVLQQAGVQILNDRRILLNQQIWLIGRIDDMAKERLKTAELLPKVLDKPIILLDHRPSEIDTHVQLPIDLQVSGHTHNGQIFPGNLIVKLLNRVSYGHQKINDTHIVVSSGYGFWGVPFRIGSQAEIWVIDLH